MDKEFGRTTHISQQNLHGTRGNRAVDSMMVQVTRLQ